MGRLAIFSGRLSDSIGLSQVLIPAILLFSLLSMVSGTATGFASLFAIRLLMGVMEVLLSNELYGDGCRVLSEPARVPPGTAAMRVRAVRAGSGPIIATQLLLVVALMALGIGHRRHSGLVVGGLYTSSCGSRPIPRGPHGRRGRGQREMD